MSTSETSIDGLAHKTSVLGPPTKADAVYAELRNQIMAGTLPPGSRIDYAYLADSLGLSITPIREALRKLEADRLVIRNAHRDVVIASLNVREARELLTVREELNVLAARLASEHMTPAELFAAKSMTTFDDDDAAAVEYLRSVQVTVSVQGVHAMNRAFHHIVDCGSHNRVLIESIESIAARTERYAALASRLEPNWKRDHRPIHSQLVAALEARDTQAAEALMRADHVGRDFAEIIFGHEPSSAEVA